jgi:hypothetical protein
VDGPPQQATIFTPPPSVPAPSTFTLPSQRAGGRRGKNNKSRRRHRQRC